MTLRLAELFLEAIGLVISDRQLKDKTINLSV